MHVFFINLIYCNQDKANCNSTTIQFATRTIVLKGKETSMQNIPQAFIFPNVPRQRRFTFLHSFFSASEIFKSILLHRTKNVYLPLILISTASLHHPTQRPLPMTSSFFEDLQNPVSTGQQVQSLVRLVVRLRDSKSNKCQRSTGDR